MIPQNRTAHNDAASSTTFFQKLKGAAKLGARGVGVCLTSVKYIGQCTALVTVGLLAKVVGATGQSSYRRCFDVATPLCTCKAAPPDFYAQLPKPRECPGTQVIEVTEVTQEAPDSATDISLILQCVAAVVALGCATIVVYAVCTRIIKYTRGGRQDMTPVALSMSHVEQQSKLLQSGDTDDVSPTLQQSPVVERD